MKNTQFSFFARCLPPFLPLFFISLFLGTSWASENNLNIDQAAVASSPVVEIDRLPYYHFRFGETVTITGSVTAGDGSTLESYELEWTKEDSTNWSGQGITEANGGQSEVTDGTVGSWDTSVVNSSGFYSIRIRANAPGISSFRNILRLYVDKTLVNGWPKRFTDVHFGTPRFPRIVDINGDGKDDLLVQDSSGKIYVWDRNGNALPGWPVDPGTGQKFGAAAVGDLNKDGKIEVVVPHMAEVGGILPEPCSFPVLHIFDSNGREWSSSPIEASCNNNSATDFNLTEAFPRRRTSLRPPVLYDMDGDGDLEILASLKQVVTVSPSSNAVVTRQLEFHAYHHGGGLVSGWPYSVEYFPGIQFRHIAVGDITGDSKPEYFFAVQAKTIDTQEAQLFALDVQGQPEFANPLITDSDIPRNFAIANLNGGGGKLFLTSALWEWVPPAQEGYSGYWTIDSHRTLGLGSGFSAIPGWPIEPVNSFAGTGETIVADVDGNGSMEVLFTHESSKPLEEDQYQIRAIGANGNEVSSWPKNLDWSVRTPPIAGDLDLDGEQDVLVFGTDPWQQGIDGFGVGYFEVVNHSDRSLSGLPKTVVDQFSANLPTFIYGDLGSNGKADIAMVTGKGKIFVWEMPYCYDTASMDWPMSGHDTHNTNNFATKAAYPNSSDGCNANTSTDSDQETGESSDPTRSAKVSGGGCSIDSASALGWGNFLMILLLFSMVVLRPVRGKEAA